MRERERALAKATADLDRLWVRLDGDEGHARLRADAFDDDALGERLRTWSKLFERVDAADREAKQLKTRLRDLDQTVLVNKQRLEYAEAVVNQHGPTTGGDRRSLNPLSAQDKGIYRRVLELVTGAELSDSGTTIGTALAIVLRAYLRQHADTEDELPPSPCTDADAIRFIEDKAVEWLAEQRPGDVVETGVSKQVLRAPDESLTTIAPDGFRGGAHGNNAESACQP